MERANAEIRLRLITRILQKKLLIVHLPWCNLSGSFNRHCLCVTECNLQLWLWLLLVGFTFIASQDSSGCRCQQINQDWNLNGYSWKYNMFVASSSSYRDLIYRRTMAHSREQTQKSPLIPTKLIHLNFFFTRVHSMKMSNDDPTSDIKDYVPFYRFAPKVNGVCSQLRPVLHPSLVEICLIVLLSSC